MAYYDRYLIELDNYRIYIRLKDSSSSLQEIGPVIKNISLDLQEVDRDVTSPLVKTLLSLTFVDAPDLGQDKCGDWEEFFTPDSTKWMIDIMDMSGNLVWSGFVTPDSYLEELRYRGNVTIIARDGVGRLQDFDFGASGDEQGMISLRELVEIGWSLTESKMALTWGEGKSDAWMVCDGSMAYDTYMNVSAFEGMSWYEAIEAALASYGACMRYIGDGRMAVVSLRYLPKLRNLTRSGSVNYGSPTFLSFGTRELQPSLKEIREKISYDLDKANVPLGESIAFTGESSNALALIGGLSKEVETTVHNISSSVWETISADTSLFFDKSTMILADVKRLGISDNAILIAACVQQTNRMIWCNIPMVPDSINLVLEWGNKIAKEGRYLYILDNDSEVHMYYYLTAVSKRNEWYYNGQEWVSDTLTSLQITATNGKMSIPISRPPLEDSYTLRLTIQYPSIRTTTKDTIYSGIYLSINNLYVETSETKSLVATNSVKTIYNGANNIIINREPKFGPAFTPVGLPAFIKNGIFQKNNGHYHPTPKWTWNAGGSLQQMAVYNHLCIISYYAKPNNILQGTILYDSTQLIDPALIWVWNDRYHLLRSGSFDLLNNRINNAVLLEYDDYDSLWGRSSTALPDTLTSSSATNGTTNRDNGSGGGGSSSGGGGTSGGGSSSITIDTEMSDTSTNAVQNKVIKKYVDSTIQEVKNDNARSSNRSAGPQVTMLQRNIEGNYYIRFNHPWLSSLAAEVVLMHYNANAHKKIAEGDHRKSKGWRMAHGRGLSFVARGRNISIDELRNYIIRGWLKLDELTDDEMLSVYYEQIKNTMFDKCVFRNTGKKSKTFGWAVRYPNPAFNDIADAGEVKDGTTMIAGVPRWIYSDVSPMDIFVHYVQNVGEQKQLVIGLRLT